MKKLFFIFLLIANHTYSQTTELWGMTSHGGYYNQGTVFKINSDGTNFQVIHEFDSINGRIPTGNLILSSNNFLYGYTQAGGIYDWGILFNINPFNYLFAKKFEFNSNSNSGGTPMGSLIEYSSNNKLYGMNWNALFDYNVINDSLTPCFSFGIINGWLPYETAMIEASNHKLYGMTAFGGIYHPVAISGSGVIFSYDPITNFYTKIHDFDSIGGMQPYGSLIQYIDGLLYGVTSGGGAFYQGVIFSIDTLGTFNKLFDFDATTGRPFQGFCHATNDTLYNATASGGAHNYGTIFSYDPISNTYQKLHDFDSINGSGPNGALIQGSDGKLYGMTISGGTYNCGTIFSFALSSNTFTKIHDFDGTHGKHPGNGLLEIQGPTIHQELNSLDKDLNIFPNPSENFIKVKTHAEITNISLLNLLGECVIQKTISSPSTDIQIDMRSLNPSIYLLIARGNNFNATVRVIKK